MRRKPGMLLPLELALLEAGLDLARRGESEFHGFAIAKQIQEVDGAKRLTAHGTLYKALARMEKSGLLHSRWEDPSVAADEQRPRRRLYEVTAEGERALARSHAAVGQPGKPLTRPEFESR
ncbi:MAG: PadR family transcriptional regulator [Actinomycetota bacterium]